MSQTPFFVVNVILLCFVVDQSRHWNIQQAVKKSKIGIKPYETLSLNKAAVSFNKWRDRWAKIGTYQKLGTRLSVLHLNQLSRFALQLLLSLPHQRRLWKAQQLWQLQICPVERWQSFCYPLKSGSMEQKIQVQDFGFRRSIISGQSLI